MCVCIDQGLVVWFQEWCVYEEVVHQVNTTVNGTQDAYDVTNVTDVVGIERCKSSSYILHVSFL